MIAELIAEVVATVVFEGGIHLVRYAFFTEGFEAVPDHLRSEVLDALVLAALWNDDRVDEAERDILLGAMKQLDVKEERAEHALLAAVDRVSSATNEPGARKLVSDLAAKLLDPKARTALAASFLLLQQERPGAPRLSLFDLVAGQWGWGESEIAAARKKAAEARAKAAG